MMFLVCCKCVQHNATKPTILDITRLIIACFIQKSATHVLFILNNNNLCIFTLSERMLDTQTCLMNAMMQDFDFLWFRSLSQSLP